MDALALRWGKAGLAALIPVELQREPETFDVKVRQPGLRWLKKKKLRLDQPASPRVKLEAYWRHCLDDLHRSYSGICAYLCVHLERPAGGVSADHFVAKSRKLSLAYEWSNYRLACSTMNARKRDFEDVLDPFELVPNTFRLELVTGRIYASPEIPAILQAEARDTLERLRLDSAQCREMRARHYQEYRQGLFTSKYLLSRSPFVWYEANRQGLL